MPRLVARNVEITTAVGADFSRRGRRQSPLLGTGDLPPSRHAPAEAGACSGYKLLGFRWGIRNHAVERFDKGVNTDIRCQVRAR